MPSTKPRISRAEALAELQRRIDEAIAAFTPEAIAGGHPSQIEILTGDWTALVLMCSRRAGKSIVCVALCALTALRTKNVRCLYLSLTKDQSAPRFNECKVMFDRYGIPYESNESDQTVTLENGSMIRFTGIDDKKRAGVFKGDQLASGIAIVDEAQDDPGLLEWLLTDVLDPMVSETTADKPDVGRIVVAGVVPDSEAGYFWKLWTENFDEDAHAPKPDAAWKCMGWGRIDNPHEHNFDALLAAHMAKYKLRRDDPRVLRNWDGLRVFDATATAYHYSIKLNSWTGKPAPWLGTFKCPEDRNGLPLGSLLAVEPPPGVTMFGIGIDPASRRDCCTLVVNGWGERTRDVYEVAEFVSVPKSGIRQDQWIDVLIQLRAHYAVMRQMRDAGSAAEDIFLHDYKILIEAVDKGPGSVKDRVERTGALLGQGLYHALAGGQLEAQYGTVRWDPRARERGRWTLLASIPNDVSDAGDYGLVPYFDATEPKKKPETLEEQMDRQFRETFAPPVVYGFQEDAALTQLLGDTGPAPD